MNINNFLQKLLITFLLNLAKNVLKYILFILPFVLTSKALYICWHDDIWTFTYYSQQFISNVPFFGQILLNKIWGVNFLLSLDNILNNQKITQLIFVGGLGSCLAKTIFETWFSDYLKLPALLVPKYHGYSSDGGEMPFVKIPLILKSTEGSDLNLGSDSRNVLVQNTEKGISSSGSADVPFWKMTIETFYKDISPGFDKYIEHLKKMNDKTVYYTLEVPKNNKDPKITEANLAKNLLFVQQTHSKILTGSFQGRDGWLNELRHLLSEEDKRKIEEISEKIDKAKENYFKKAESLESSDPQNLRSALKQFFDFTNAYRNTVKKELSKADAIMQKGFKEHPLYKKEEFKKMINSDYPKLLKSFHDEDERLKKKFLEEVFNKPKDNK